MKKGSERKKQGAEERGWKGALEERKDEGSRRKGEREEGRAGNEKRGMVA